MYPSRHHPHWDGVFVQGVAWVGLAPHDSSIRTEGEKLGNRDLDLLRRVKICETEYYLEGGGGSAGRSWIGAGPGANRKVLGCCSDS